MPGTCRVIVAAGYSFIRNPDNVVEAVSEPARLVSWTLPADFKISGTTGCNDEYWWHYPDRPVIALVSDGGFLFSGPQPLWSYARYKAGITVVVINNRSYNNIRNRIWAGSGRQFETGCDMVCYLGDPDVSYAQLGAAFGIESETIDAPGKIRASLKRALRANSQGRPYLLDCHVERRGTGALSTWHPPFTINSLRQLTRT